MSQAKVDQHKKEKYARKHTQKKSNIKKILAYVVVTIIAVLAVAYLGWSVAVSTGLYEPKTTMSAAEKESLQNVLIQQNDPNIQFDVDETTVATDTTVAE